MKRQRTSVRFRPWLLILTSALVIPIASGFTPGATFSERVLWGVIEGVVLAVITGKALQEMQRRRNKKEKNLQVVLETQRLWLDKKSPNICIVRCSQDFIESRARL